MRWKTGVRAKSGSRLILPIGVDFDALWDADGTMTLSGSNVQTWTDGVASYVASKGDANGPTYSATGFMSSRPGVTFNGSSHYLLANAAAEPLFGGDDTPVTACFHVVFNSTSAQYLCSAESNNPSTTGAYTAQGRSSSTQLINRRASNSNSSNATSSAYTITSGIEHVLIYSYQGSNTYFWLNGVRSGPHANNVPAFATLLRMALGCWIVSGTPGSYFNGVMRRAGFRRSRSWTDRNAADLYALWFGS